MNVIFLGNESPFQGLNVIEVRTEFEFFFSSNPRTYIGWFRKRPFRETKDDRTNRNTIKFQYKNSDPFRHTRICCSSLPKFRTRSRSPASIRSPFFPKAFEDSCASIRRAQVPSERRSKSRHASLRSRVVLSYKEKDARRFL